MINEFGNLLVNPADPGFNKAVRGIMGDVGLSREHAERLALLLFDQFPDNLLDDYSEVNIRGDQLYFIAISGRNGERRSFEGDPEYVITMAEEWLRTIPPSRDGREKQLRHAEWVASQEALGG